MPWDKYKGLFQILQIITNIVVIIGFILVVNQYSLLRQEYEWKFGDPEVIMYNHDVSATYATIGPNISFDSIRPKNDIFICNSRGRPILLMGIYPVLQGPMNYYPEKVNYSEKIFRQNDCEELRINFPPIDTLYSEKVDGTYKLNVTVNYFDKDKLEEIYFVWELFEIKNKTVIKKG